MLLYCLIFFIKFLDLLDFLSRNKCSKRGGGGFILGNWILPCKQHIENTIFRCFDSFFRILSLYQNKAPQYLHEYVQSPSSMYPGKIKRKVKNYKHVTKTNETIFISSNIYCGPGKSWSWLWDTWVTSSKQISLSSTQTTFYAITLASNTKHIIKHLIKVITP